MTTPYPCLGKTSPPNWPGPAAANWHYWVLSKLLIIITAVFMLLMKTGPIGYMASVAAEGTLGPTDLRGLRLSILGHSVGGLAVLLWAMALGTYKPNARTPFARNASERPG